MESSGIGESVGLHYALSALHGLALLDASKLPPTLGPMLLRKAELMWWYMVNDSQGIYSRL